MATTKSTSGLIEHEIAGTVTASVGWTITQAGHGRVLAELIREADAAMYQRKRMEDSRLADMSR